MFPSNLSSTLKSWRRRGMHRKWVTHARNDHGCRPGIAGSLRMTPRQIRTSDPVLLSITYLRPELWLWVLDNSEASDGSGRNQHRDLVYISVREHRTTEIRSCIISELVPILSSSSCLLHWIFPSCCLLPSTSLSSVTLVLMTTLFLHSWSRPREASYLVKSLS